ncbi:unnamed protein product [Closterium sp. NIES-53]
MATSTSTLVGNLIILNLAPNGTSTNFEEWCYGVEKHLLSSELKGICLKDILLNRGKGKMPLPPDPLGEGATATAKLAFDAKTTKYETDFSLWEQADAAVIRVFITTTPVELVKSYRTFRSAHDIWKCLQDRFHDKTAVGVAILIHRMFQIRLEECPGMADYISEIRNIHEELKDIGTTFPEQAPAAGLLVGLTPAYNVTSSMLKQLPTKELTFEKIASALLSAEKDLAAQASINAVRYSPGIPFRSQQVQRRKSFPPCQYLIRKGPCAGQKCNGTNHPEATCFKKRDDEWYDVHGVSKDKRPPNWAPPRRVNQFQFYHSLPTVPNPESDLSRAASPTVSSLLATVVIGPSSESNAASALVVVLVDFTAACRLDYATALVAEYESASPPSLGDECALGTDVLEDRQEDFECLAVAVPHLVAMVLAPEGDLDAPDIPTPRSYAEAITGHYSSQWQTAMDAEMASWKSTGTYIDEVPPAGANIVNGMWIFRGVDCFQIFSPTPKMTTLRVLLQVAAQRDYEVHSLEFSTTFLQVSLHEEIWLHRPPGFTGSFPAGTQWNLRRPVYGLHKARREWHDTLRTTLAAVGFNPSTADPSLFQRTDTSLPLFYVLVYVDDLVFATADIEAVTLVKSELHKRHTCTDLGELRSYLGLQITRDRAPHTITLTQSHMVHLVLQCFGFQFSSPQPTPLSTGHSLSAPPSDESVEPSGPYPEFVGCLMYLMMCTRRDLVYPLSLVARYVALGRHRKVHWDVVKRVLCYLCSTSGMRLVLGGRGPVVLTGHTDASWVDDLATQRSSQDYTFSLGSGFVSWRSTRSSSVLSSSCQAEIYAGSMATQELRWLTYLLSDLGEQPRSPPVLYVDNKAMIALCQEHRLEHRTKHIALRYFLARELQQRGQLCLAYMATRANTAYIFTKAHESACFGFRDWSWAKRSARPRILSRSPDKGSQEEVRGAQHRPRGHPGGMHGRGAAARRGHQQKLQGIGAAAVLEQVLTSSPLLFNRRAGNIKKSPPAVVRKWVSKAWRAVPAELIKKAFLTCGISNALDGSEDKLAMAHRRSQLTHEVDVDDEIHADGFWGNNCQEHDAAPLVALPSPALPCPSRRPALPAVPSCWLRAGLPCPSRCLAGHVPPSPACRVALLAVASTCPARAPPCSACESPCPARAPHCWQPRRPALPARRPALPVRRPSGHRSAARTALLRAALLANALLPARRPAACAPP